MNRGEQNEPQAKELKEAEQLHGPEPHSKSALGRAGQSWNQTKEFNSSLWWVPVESFPWLCGENRWQIITSSGLSGNKLGAQCPVLTFSFKQDTAASE